MHWKYSKIKIYKISFKEHCLMKRSGFTSEAKNQANTSKRSKSTKILAITKTQGRGNEAWLMAKRTETVACSLIVGLGMRVMI